VYANCAKSSRQRIVHLVRVCLLQLLTVYFKFSTAFLNILPDGATFRKLASTSNNARSSESSLPPFFRADLPSLPQFVTWAQHDDN
jgi:hypothetical protein